MKKIYFSLLTFCIAGFSFAQNAFQNAWSIPFMTGITPVSVSPTNDGGTISSLSSNMLATVIIKTDAAGNVQWAKALQDPNSTYMIARQVAQSVSGGYYALSDFYDYNTGSQGYLISKLDANGLLMWTKFYVAPGPYEGVASISETAAGEFIVSMGLDQQIQEFKTDANGNLLWTSAFREDPNYAYKEPGFGCAISSDGSVLLLGMDNDGQSTSLLKTSATGSLQWSHVFATSAFTMIPGDVAATSDGGDLFLGNDAAYHPMLIKFDNAGNIAWTKNYSSVNPISYNNLTSLANGNYLISGTDASSQYNFCEVDANGDVVNSGLIGNSANLNYNAAGACTMSSGGIAVIGSFANSNNSMSGVALCRSTSSNSFGCQYSSSTITAATMTSPTTTTVAINSVPAPLTVAAYTINEADVNVLAVDFCSIASVSAPVPVPFSISAFPSPVSSGDNGHLAISGASGNSTISVYDASGKLIKQIAETFSSNAAASIDIATTDLSGGIYLVRVTGQDASMVLGTAKFVVK